MGICFRRSPNPTIRRSRSPPHPPARGGFIFKRDRPPLLAGERLTRSRAHSEPPQARSTYLQDKSAPDVEAVGRGYGRRRRPQDQRGGESTTAGNPSARDLRQFSSPGG